MHAEPFLPPLAPQKKPYSAVTAMIENLTTEEFDVDDLSGLVELADAISLQRGGPTEAARAIRKKLKYGGAHRQTRALMLLDGLMQNAGSRFQREFADEPLLERLRVCRASELTVPAVRDKCNELFRQWRRYAGTPGMEKIARLHEEVPRRDVTVKKEQSKVVRETEENPFGDDEEEEATRRAAAAAAAAASSTAESSSHKRTRTTSVSGSSFFSSRSRDSSSKKSSTGKKGGKRGRFNLEAEKEQIDAVIVDASQACAELLRVLQSIDRERERVSANQAATQRFEACKQLRRRVLRYIYNVEPVKLLNALLQVNDELVSALMAYEQLDQSMDADSDSDDEIAEQAHLYNILTGQRGHDPATHDTPAVDRLNVNKPGAATARAPPPRPPAPSPKAPRRPPVVAPGDDLESASEDDDDDDDPFGDSHVVVGTPTAVDRHEPRW